MKSTKKALFTSVLSLLLCVSMLIGTTFAWFTDTVTSGTNQIVAGNLDIELYHSSTGVADEKVTESTKLFQMDLWEPGAVIYENFKIKNEGTLALKYALSFGALTKNYVAEPNGTGFKGTGRSLVDVLYIKVLESALTARPNYTSADGMKLSTFLTTNSMSYESLLAGAEKNLSVVIYWPQTDNDNLYNLNNGKTSTASAGTGAVSADGKNALEITFPITLNAAQYTHEVDSFDNKYDKDAPLAIEDIPGTIVATVIEAPAPVIGTPTVEELGADDSVAPNGTKVTTVTEHQAAKVTTVQKKNADGTPVGDPEVTTEYQDVTITSANESVKVEIPKEISEANAHTAYSVEVTPNNDVPSGITVAAGAAVHNYEIKVKDQNGAVVNSSSVNGRSYKITLNVGQGMVPSEVKMYHSGELINSTYDPATGEVTFYTDTFSPFTSVCSKVFAGGAGTEADPYLIANAQQMKNIYKAFNGCHFKLTDDITVKSNYTVSGWDVVTPYLANGSFDGDGHTITVSDAACETNLFYLVQDATIKNVNVVLNYAAVAFCQGTVNFNNVDVSGEIEVTGNDGAYAVYGLGGATMNFTDCVADVEMSGNSYNAVFVGYVNGSGVPSTLNFTRCENKGSLVCNYAAMFIGNPNNYNVVCNVTDCVNSGLIQATSTDEVFNYYYAYRSNCYETFTINGTVYNDIADKHSSAPTCNEDPLVTTTGQAIQGPVNCGLALAQNEDGTFTVSRATIEGKVVDHYTVYVGVYAGMKNENGSSRNYATETVSGDNLTTAIKNLNFVDDDWVAAHLDAVVSELAGNVTYTLDGTTYYLLGDHENDTLHGNAKAPQMIYVVAYDAANKTLASAQLFGNVA